MSRGQAMSTRTEEQKRTMAGGEGFFGLDLWAQVLLSAAFASLVTILSTVAIEKLGGFIGGVLATTPTTIMPARPVYNYSSHYFADVISSMFVVPGGMLVNAMFLYLWRAVPPRLPTAWSFRKRLIAMVTISLCFWLACAVLLWAFTTYALTTRTSAIACGLGFLLCTVLIGAAACFRPLPAPKGHRHVRARVLFLRGAFAGLSIGIAVLLSTTSSEAAGIVSVFPSIFLTSMVALWLSQHSSVPIGAVGPMMLGSASVSVYAVLYAIFVVYQEVDALAAVPLCWLLSVILYSTPTFLFIKWRTTQTASTEEAKQLRAAAEPASSDSAAEAGSQAATGRPPLRQGDHAVALDSITIGDPQ